MKKSLFNEVFTNKESKYFSSKNFWIKYLLKTDKIEKKSHKNEKIKDFVGIITNKRLGSAVKRNRARRQLMGALKEVEMISGIYVFGITDNRLIHKELIEDLENFLKAIK